MISTTGRRGSVHARSLGAKSRPRRDLIYFIDADVCVYPETLARLASDFAEAAELDGVVGSYDDSPRSGDFLSQAPPPGWPELL